MIYLILSVLSSSILYVVFKLFGKYDINILQAIVVNYLVACTCGLIAYDGEIIVSEIPNYDWFYGSIVLGILFIIVFNLMAITTQRSGLSVVSVASKMSVVFPIAFGILYYAEGAGTLKIIGIIAALFAVYFASIKSDGIAIKKKNLIFPALVFIGSGIIETSINLLQNSFKSSIEAPIFSSTLFIVAFSTGVLVICFNAMRGKVSIKGKNLIAGVVLGIPNYFSIYFLIQALRSNGLESSTVFTINNVATVMFSTFLGIILFKEKLIPKNWLGIGLAILSIILVATSI